MKKKNEKNTKIEQNDWKNDEVEKTFTPKKSTIAMKADGIVMPANPRIDPFQLYEIKQLVVCQFYFSIQHFEEIQKTHWTLILYGIWPPLWSNPAPTKFQFDEHTEDETNNMRWNVMKSEPTLYWQIFNKSTFIGMIIN